MIVGVSIGSFSKYSFSQGLIKSLTYLENNKIDAVEIKLQTVEDAENVNNRFFQNFLIDKYDLFISKGLHLPNFIIQNTRNDNQNKKIIISKIHKIIEIFQEFNIDYFVVHCCLFPDRHHNYENYSHCYDIISSITEYFENNHLLLTLENGNALIDLAEMVNLVRSIDSKSLKITLDLGHAHIRNNYQSQLNSICVLPFRIFDCIIPISKIKLFMPYKKYEKIDNFFLQEKDLIHNIHLHDYNGIKDHLPLNTGNIDFSFLKTVKANYNGIFTIEIKYDNLDMIKSNYMSFLGMIQ
jgi:sugar phosphate isomerase/epimerase